MSFTAGSKPPRPSRRRFLNRFGFALSTLFFRNTGQSLANAGTPATGGTPSSPPPSQETPSLAAAKPANHRLEQAVTLREAAARRNAALPVAVVPSTAERPPLFALYCKALPHDEQGEAVASAYAVYERALASGDTAEAEKIPLGGQVLLSNPLAAHAYTLEGCDPSQVEIASPPSFDSAEMAAEVAELYWMALLRDVPFAEYEENVLVAEAAAALSKLSNYHAPKDPEGKVIPVTLFRDSTAGSLAGPHLSQFLWLDIPYGATHIVQRYKVTAPGINFLTDSKEWLSVQRGYFPRDANFYDPQARYMRNGRDLAECVHRDFVYQGFLSAALIMLGAPYARHEPRVPFSRRNPYPDSQTQTGFVTFGGPHVFDLLPRVTSLALKACWYEKWLCFQRLRPEEMGGRVHHHLAGQAKYPLHEEIFGCPALEKVKTKYGSWLLPQAYPEGCPTHPSYPGAHAAIAGACATVLKALFDEKFPVPNPVVPVEDGTKLKPYVGKPMLTVGGELDKLAANIGFGRSWAGIHWRSDSSAGLRVGEQVAVSVLRDWMATYPDAPTIKSSAYTFTGFDGRQITL